MYVKISLHAYLHLSICASKYEESTYEAKKLTVFWIHAQPCLQVYPASLFSEERNLRGLR